ncbi:YceI family protein [Actinopolymorpha singaporensis]|uniref:Polyisoprenoid-binding protein YceI n=1 Tax=Actinopolymorpha singaporensis TaxID=117157 RepID=A0A1H1U7A1_9ACTN|nr:YceI family protein [Actinopolymorpha singaporensis]SDS68445.1 Polyisoprenoid-binding protein YceI [Actinopolymorpha singaporensis]
MSTLTTPPELTAGTWTIDPVHSEVGFTVRHLMTKVRGSFRDFEGTLEIADDVAASKVNVQVQLASIDTGNQQRDDHVRSGDFFDIEKFPTMTFVSTGVRPHNDGFVLVGDLTIKDVTKQVELVGEYLGVDDDAYGNTRVGFDATTTINRKDFGVDANVPLGGEKFLIGNEIAVQLSVQAILQK